MSSKVVVVTVGLLGLAVAGVLAFVGGRMYYARKHKALLGGATKESAPKVDQAQTVTPNKEGIYT